MEPHTATSGSISKLVGNGKLRALAVGGKNRVRELPDIPTMREVGFDCFCYAALVRNWRAP
jgi:tripartite-type tricarboxylate transporter receptor subunit TctC